MKKGLKILFISLFVILISGCGKSNKEVVSTCTLSSNQSSNGYKISSNYEIHSKDGLVNSVTTKETVESDNEQVRSYFKKTLEDSYNTANESYGGYTYNVTEDGNKVISDVTIDYSKMDLEKSTGNVKAVNLASNISALITFILAGKILWTLGLAASCFSIAGHYTGAGMVMHNGVKIIKPIILVVLVLLLIKVISGM